MNVDANQLQYIIKRQPKKTTTKSHPDVAYSLKSFFAKIIFNLSRLYLGFLCLLLFHIYIQIIYYIYISFLRFALIVYAIFTVGIQTLKKLPQETLGDRTSIVRQKRNIKNQQPYNHYRLFKNGQVFCTIRQENRGKSFASTDPATI